MEPIRVTGSSGQAGESTQHVISVEGDDSTSQRGLRKKVSGRKMLRLITVQESEATFGRKWKIKQTQEK